MAKPLEEIVAQLSDRHADQRVGAVQALRARRDLADAPLLIGALGDRSVRVRKASTLALRKLGRAAEDLLVAGLGTDPRGAACALTLSRSPSGRRRLAEQPQAGIEVLTAACGLPSLAGHDWNGLLRALVVVPSTQIHGLIRRALRHNSLRTQLAAVDALAAIANRFDRELLLDPDLKPPLTVPEISALGTLADPEAILRLRRIVGWRGLVGGWPAAARGAARTALALALDAVRAVPAGALSVAEVPSQAPSAAALALWSNDDDEDEDEEEDDEV